MGTEAEKIRVTDINISKSKGEEEEGIMGKIMVKAKMKNFVDEDLARRGILKQEEVREEEKEGLVDTGATMLTLPEELVDELGLTRAGFVTAGYADGTKRILIGQIPLEEMDLIVDPKTGNLIPRPESPDMPLIDVFEYSTWRGSRR